MLGKNGMTPTKPKKAMAAIPSWTDTAPSTGDLPLQTHYLSSGLKPDQLHKACTKLSAAAPHTRCHLNV